MEKKRKGLTSGINIEGLTEGGLTKEGTFFKDGIEMVPPFGALPARPRFLTLSDGQVLDRANKPDLFSRWGARAVNTIKDVLIDKEGHHYKLIGGVRCRIK